MTKSGKKITEIVKTLYGEYKVTFESEPDMGGYMIRVPKRPDVFSWGKNKTHAKRMAQEAIECSVEGEMLIAFEKEGIVTIKKQRFSLA